MLIMGTMLAVLSSILVGIMFIMVSMPFKTIAQNLAADEDGLVRPLSIVGGIEFRNFITAYNKLVDDVIAKTKEVTVWRTRIRNELKQADEVQTLLVPNEIRQSGIDARNIPLRELSGDFHEVFTDNDGRRTMILGDVAGKGIYAAMMAAQTLTAFRAAVHKDNLADVLVTLNTLIEDRFPAGLFVALTLFASHPTANQPSFLLRAIPKLSDLAAWRGRNLSLPGSRHWRVAANELCRARTSHHRPYRRFIIYFY